MISARACAFLAVFIPSVALYSQADVRTPIQLDSAARGARTGANLQLDLELLGPSARQDEARLQIVQLDGPTQARWIEALSAEGLVVLDYLPPSAYVVHGPRAAIEQARAQIPISWTGAFAPSLKLQPRLRSLLESTLANSRDASRRLNLIVQYFDVPGVPDLGRSLEAAGLKPRSRSRVRNRWHLRVEAPPSAVTALARWDTVFRIELAPEYKLLGERSSMISAGAYSDGATCVKPGYFEWLARKALSGRGVIVQVQDDGIEQGNASGDPGTAHADLLGRIAGVDNATNDPLGDSGAGHGSINAGIIAGNASTGVRDGEGFLSGLGIAPSAAVFATKIFKNSARFEIGSRTFSDLARVAIEAGCTVSSNSWGAAIFGEYDAAAAEFDALTRDAHPNPGDQPMIFVFAAGNEGDLSPNGEGTVGSPASAKNVISVGAGENCDADGTDGCDVGPDGANSLMDLISFSSRGPVTDGRLGVTLIATGTHVSGPASTSTSYDGTGVCDQYWPVGQALYARSSGTSHATPQVAGAAALFNEHRVQIGAEVPSPALVKAALAASARDRAGGADGFGGALTPVPSPAQGWGALSMEDLLPDASAAQPQTLFFDAPAVLGDSGEEWETFVFSLDESRPLKVALAWTDPPAIPGTSPSLVNDLDLEVESGGSLYLGNVLKAGRSVLGGEPDRLNNLECVFLDHPASLCKIRVRGHNIAGDGVPGNDRLTDQDFSVAVIGATDQSSRGVVVLGASAFACGSKAGLTVSDSDLKGAGTVDVGIASTSHPEALTVRLSESTAGSGIFRGEVQLGLGAGELAVQHGDIVTALYHDANDGSGRAADSRAQAAVDCQGPVISAVEVVEVTDTTAVITFKTDEDARPTVRNGTSCADISGSTGSRAVAREHRLTLSGLQPGSKHFFAASAEDRVGNASSDDRLGKCYAFVTSVPFCVFSEDVEPTPDPRWTHKALTGPDDWKAIFFPPAHSPKHCWRATSFDGAKDDVLVSPPIDVFRGDRLSFWHLYGFEESFDGGVLEVSTDAGKTWQDLGPAFVKGGYTEILESGPLAGRPAWTGTNGNAMTEVSADLTAFEGPARLFRFRLVCDDFGVDGVGWHVDDFGVCQLINKKGKVTAARSVVRCEDTVRVTVADFDLTGAGSVTLDVTTTGENPRTTITLTEAPPTSGIFSGDLAVGAGPDRVAVRDGDRLTVSYRDADDGVSDSPVTVSAEVRIDCVAPVISAVRILEVIGGQAAISWETSEPSTGEVDGGLNCGAATISERELLPGMSHSVVVQGLKQNATFYFKVTAVDAAGNTTVDDGGGACRRVTQIALCELDENFDGAVTGWSHAAAAGKDAWLLGGRPQAHTKPRAWFVTDPDELADSSLVSPLFLVPAESFLVFWHTYGLEQDYDGAVIEISKDGGTTWEDLGQLITSGGYNTVLTGANPIAGRRAWSGGQIGPMTPVIVSLSTYAGAWCQVRFRLVADPSDPGDGWVIDDVQVCEAVRERGTIDFDRRAYPCEAAVTLRVRDTGLIGRAEINVKVWSTSEPAGETVRLSETTAGSGVYAGSLNISRTNAGGVLQVAPGDHIDARYADADDGTGAAAEVQATSSVDCEPPRITGVRVLDLAEDSAVIEWLSDGETTGRVEIGTACGEVDQSLEERFPAATHRTSVRGLNPGTLYFFRIVAEDLAGNTATSDVAGACFQLRTPVVFCAFDDPLSPSAQDGWQSADGAWRLVTTGLAHTPNRAWSVRTTGSRQDSELVLPPIYLEPGSMLELWHTYELPLGEAGGVLEASKDGGESWEDLDQRIIEGAYTGFLSAENPLGGRQGWTGGQIGPMTRVRASLDDFAGTRLLVRLRFAASGLAPSKGWYIDDVRVCRRVGESGAVAFSRTFYPCDASVSVVLADASLQGAGSVAVELTSTRQTTPQPLTLIEKEPGLFRGDIALFDMKVPGLLYAGDGDLLRVTYTDHRDAEGKEVVVEDLAHVDCIGPRIEDVQLRQVGSRSIEVLWVTDEPADGALELGKSCAASGTAMLAHPFGTVHEVLLDNLDSGTDYFFKLNATDEAGNVTTETNGDRCFPLTLIASCPFEDELEPPQNGWTHHAKVGPDRWSVSTSARAHSPTRVWAGRDTDGPQDSWLITPPFDAAPDAELSFWHTFAFEDGQDGGVIEITTDGGVTWNDLGSSITEGGYNGFITDGAGDFRRGWTGGRTGAMRRVSVRLAELAGPQRQARFRLLCDGSINVEGWFIDDVSICSYAPSLDSSSFARGNCNADDKINLTDAVFLLNHLFTGGRTPPCRRACDANGDDALNLSDAIYLLNHLFLGGPELPQPEECAVVLSESPLDCANPSCVR